MDAPEYRQQRAGVRPYTLMIEGYMSVWGRNHPGEPIPDFWQKMMAKIEARHRQTAGAEDFDPFA